MTSSKMLEHSQNRCQGCLKKSKSFEEQRAEFQPSFQRSVTTSQDLLLTYNNVKPRTTSTRHISGEPIIKPRSHLSIARFYDWSEDLDNYFSVSRLYRELATISRMSVNSSQVTPILFTKKDIISSSVPTAGNQQYARNPGRMFFRDKKALTRGEREIIEGIYKNRGDIERDTSSKSEFQIKSHKDAWCVGKTRHRNLLIDKTFLRGVKVYKTSPSSCCHVNNDRPSVLSLSNQERSESAQFANSTNTAMSSELDKIPTKLTVQNSGAILLSQKCAICQANAHTLNSRSRAAQSKENYSCESPTVPPGTPDLPILRPWFQQQPFFDKLLYMRPTLSLGVCLQPENTHVHNTGYRQKQGELQSPQTAATNLYFKGIPVFLDGVSDAFSVFAIHSSRNASCKLNNKPKRLDGDAEHSQRQLLGESSNKTDLDKRIKVNIYLPTAECDQAEHDSVSVVGSTEIPSNHKHYYVHTKNLMAEVT